VPFNLSFYFNDLDLRGDPDRVPDVPTARQILPGGGALEVTRRDAHRLPPRLVSDKFGMF
jgi:hypothetical protein